MASPSESLPDQPPADANVVATIVALMAVGASVQALTPKVATLLRPMGISGPATSLAVKIAMAAPITSRQVRSLTTPAVQTTALTESTFRATYILNAARRIEQGIRTHRPMSQIIQEERQLFIRHRQNADRRLEKARAVDVAAERYGPILGWYAKRDSRTSPECLQAHGKNFVVDERPAIGYPGTVHPYCRCRPGPPHANAKRLSSRKVA